MAAAFSALFALGFNDYLLTSDLLDFLPSEVLFFLDLFQVPNGINIFASALILRFLIRRLHLIS